MSYHVRWCIRRDYPEVVDMYKSGQGILVDYSIEGFEAINRQRNTISMVVEKGEEILGCMAYELWKHKLVLVSLAVRRDQSLSELGEIMVHKLKNKLSTHRRRRIETWVYGENLAALNFLKQNDFLATGDVAEDCYKMIYTVNEWQPTNRISQLAPLWEV